jgi:hypothetical protein
MAGIRLEDSRCISTISDDNEAGSSVTNTKFYAEDLSPSARRYLVSSTRRISVIIVIAIDNALQRQLIRYLAVLSLCIVITAAVIDNNGRTTADFAALVEVVEFTERIAS